SKAFAKRMTEGLSERGYLGPSTASVAYATPRRLAVKLTQVVSVSPDKPLRQKLMPANVALDAANQPTVALRKRLEGVGHGEPGGRRPDDFDDGGRLAREQDGKAEAVFLYSVAKGVPLPAGLQAAFDDAIAALPIPKVMTYQRDGSNVKFVRPVQRLLA